MKTFTRATILASTLLMGITGIPAIADTPASSDQDISVLRDIRPAFPESALRRMIDGYVVVRFDVAENGKAGNIRIVESQPERTFDGAVATAIRRSHFDVDREVEDVERVYRFDANDGDLRQQVGMFNAFYQ